MSAADDPRKTAANPAPYDILTARKALAEAAKLNQRALDKVNGSHIKDLEPISEEYQVVMYEAAQLAQVAQGLATYALALDRWVAR